MSQASSPQIHVNAVIRDADLKRFSYDNLQHPSPKSIKRVRLANDLGLSLIKELSGAAHVLADCRFSPTIDIAFPELLHSSLLYFHI
jgi:hypothetical protein